MKEIIELEQPKDTQKVLLNFVDIKGFNLTSTFVNRESLNLINILLQQHRHESTRAYHNGYWGFENFKRFCFDFDIFKKELIELNNKLDIGLEEITYDTDMTIDHEFINFNFAKDLFIETQENRQFSEALFSKH